MEYVQDLIQELHSCLTLCCDVRVNNVDLAYGFDHENLRMLIEYALVKRGDANDVHLEIGDKCAVWHIEYIFCNDVDDIYDIKKLAKRQIESCFDVLPLDTYTLNFELIEG